MKQSISQNFILGFILLLVGMGIIVALMNGHKFYQLKKCTACDDGREEYSPYRHTGGCPPRTGYTYLDAYEQEDYYRKYPYIYPTPTNYVRALFKNRRAQYNYWDEQRRLLNEEY